MFNKGKVKKAVEQAQADVTSLEDKLRELDERVEGLMVDVPNLDAKVEDLGTAFRRELGQFAPCVRCGVLVHASKGVPFKGRKGSGEPEVVLSCVWCKDLVNREPYKFKG